MTARTVENVRTILTDALPDREIAEEQVLQVREMLVARGGSCEELQEVLQHLEAVETAYAETIGLELDTIKKCELCYLRWLKGAEVLQTHLDNTKAAMAQHHTVLRRNVITERLEELYATCDWDRPDDETLWLEAGRVAGHYERLEFTPDRTRRIIDEAETRGFLEKCHAVYQRIFSRDCPPVTYLYYIPELPRPGDLDEWLADETADYDPELPITW